MRSLRIIATLMFVMALMAEAKIKPVIKYPNNRGTSKCEWCCDYTHNGGAGNATTCNACDNTGHKSGCPGR